MKNLLTTTQHWLYALLVLTTVSISCLNASAQTVSEGIRFNMFRADRQSVLFEGASDPDLHIDMAVGTATYVYQYGSNATYTATLDQWWSDYYGDWVSWPESYAGTNRWTIDAAGALIGDPDSGAPLDYNTWTRRSNNIPVATYQDTIPYFRALENIQAKGTIPSLGRTNVDCKLDLVILGDRSDFTNDVIVKFTITATDVDTGQPIPDGDITICTKPVTNGVAWKKFTEWNTPDVTPVIAGHANYTFDLQAEIARPGLWTAFADCIGKSMTNWPDTGEKMFVGEQFWWRLELGGWSALLTDFCWGIPSGGDPIADFIKWDFFGGPVPHSSSVIRDEKFYLKKPVTNETVSVFAEIMGETFTAWAKISVAQPSVAPSATIRLPQCNSNYFNGLHCLHLGGRSNNYAEGGFKVTNSIAANSVSGEFLFAQIVNTAVWQRNVSTADPNPGVYQINVPSSKLDMAFPVTTQEILPLPPLAPTGIRMYDPPAIFSCPNDEFLSYDASFSTYLMWQSKRPAAIPVTRWRINWRFDACASFTYGTDWSSGWNIDPASIAVIDSTVESSDMPDWDENVQILLDAGYILIP